MPIHNPDSGVSEINLLAHAAKSKNSGEFFSNQSSLMRRLIPIRRWGHRDKPVHS